MTWYLTAFIGLLGAFFGSFANVVIYRLPAGKSIVFPGSHCYNCGKRLTFIDLVPILSWLFLRGRCRNCGSSISARYPLVETLMTVGFVLIALRFPLFEYGLTMLPLLVLFFLLVVLSMIDIDHFLLPDVLNFPALAVALLGPLFYATNSGLPTVWGGALGAALGAGILVFVNRLGSLVLRRFADTKERLWPVGMDQVNLAALGGALGGWLGGLGLAVLSVILNLVTRRTLRLPESVVYGLWALALLLVNVNPFISPLDAIAGTLAAAGAVAVLGALYWWGYDLRHPANHQDTDRDVATEADAVTDEEDEPVAMGFGDVKLAAVLGAMLGWQSLLVGLLFAFVFGAVGGIITQALGKGRQVPFGPYLALGSVAALFVGPQIVAWYAGLIGL